MLIYLPIAEMAVAVEEIFLLGFFVGFVSGVFGVGGGFLTTPLLIFMGIPPTVAVGTQASQLVASGTSGVIGYWKKGYVDFFVGTVMLCGGVVGTVFGIIIFELMQYLGQIDLVISLLYIILMGSVGGMMLFESVFSLSKGKRKSVKHEFNRFNSPSLISRLPYKMRFPRSKLYISAFVPAGIGFVSGFLVSTMGVGGGFLLVPAMIYILGMPAYLVAGTSLFQIIFTSAFSTIMHAVTNNSVDILLALFLIIGGVIGARFGVMASKKVKGARARVILALIVLAVCTKMAVHLFLTPDNFFVTVM
ncbi:MAG: sulfite exporter TauE/SafE family protein [Alphaproteobacteria bacterium]|nr:sulfite exporter TauE/SafE family protein [Alphaproteobacteria bacterium]